MSIKIVHYICLFLAFVAFVLNLTANSADRWWEALEPQEFENIGLWQICFNMYRHRFDFYGKIYTGCWWLFSPEIRQLFSWVSTPWFRVVQAFSTLSMITMLFALAMVYILARSKNLGKVSSRYVLATAFVTLTSGKIIDGTFFYIPFYQLKFSNFFISFQISNVHDDSCLGVCYLRAQ